MPDLPARPSLEHLRKHAKAYRREHGVGLARAQRDIAAGYGFDSWPGLVRNVHANALLGIERTLALADSGELDSVLRGDSTAATAVVAGMPPLITLLRRSSGTPSDVRRCAVLLLDGGADPNSAAPPEDGGEWETSALFYAVERRDITLLQLLLARGAAADDDAF